MSDALGDLLELLVGLLKKLVGPLIQFLFELIFEVGIDRAVRLIERQHQFLYRHAGTRWLSVPLTIASCVMMMAVPIILLIALLRVL